MNSIRSSVQSDSHSRGLQILTDPARNRDAAFTVAERDVLGLHGWLPSAVLTIEQQVAMELEHLNDKPSPLEQYIGLIALLNRNETLFYRVLVENIERLTPVVYTPTVGLACQQFSHIFRRPRGLFLSPQDRGKIADRIRNFSDRDVRLLVATDNERILGLGDQGVGGMGIPIGKLMLYSAGAGIHPGLCLPVCLDVGTDNGALLDDPLYLGWRGRRLRGPEYDEFIEEFVQAVKTVFPRALLQWEDFKKVNAFRLLERYQKVLPSFNDDIQGTAAVALGGILAGVRLSGIPLSEHRFLHLGAGAAGVGIGTLLRQAMAAEGVGVDAQRRNQAFFDSTGLVTTERGQLDAHKQAVALNPGDLEALKLDRAAQANLAAFARAYRPTALIGTSATPGSFTEELIRTVSAGTGRPMIFPLSNPTSKSECTAAEAIRFSGGRALVATGSPSAPVSWGGGTYTIGQCNNVFIFPGLGLGALVCEAREVSEKMFLSAARALAEITVRDFGGEMLYPPLSHLRKVSLEVARAVARDVRDAGLGLSLTNSEIEDRISQFCWFPNYPKGV